MSKKEWAVRYATAGWSIFPGIKKEPFYSLLVRTGHKRFDPDRKEWKATYSEFFEKPATVEEVEKWWTMEPDADIKLCCGRVSGVTVVDIDAKKPTDDDPGAVLGALGAFGMVARSGSGRGFHGFCAWSDIPSGDVIRQVEIKNDRTTVTLAPSGHESGGIYAWDDLLTYSESNARNLLAVPETLAAMARENRKKDPSEWLAMIKGVDGGGRNETATRLVGKALWALWIEFKGQPELVPFLWDFIASWNQRNNPPLSERELETIFKSVIRKQYGSH